MSSRLERRRFLVLAAASGALIACKREDENAHPAQAAESPRADDAHAGLRAAAERARESGRPLLVMLAQSARLPRDHGWVWTRYLASADAPALADLAMCELAFTSCERAGALWPGAELRCSDAPLAIVVLPEDGSIVPVRIDQAGRASLLAFEDLEHVPSDPEQQRAWVHALAVELHRVLAPDDATFERRARRVLGDTPLARAEWTAELARRASAFLAASAPAGSRWAEDNGCGGFWIDGAAEEETLTLCGMGYADEASRRFLHLYPVR